jgi:hypothetical protein
MIMTPAEKLLAGFSLGNDLTGLLLHWLYWAERPKTRPLFHLIFWTSLVLNVAAIALAISLLRSAPVAEVLIAESPLNFQGRFMLTVSSKLLLVLLIVMAI